MASSAPPPPYVVPNYVSFIIAIGFMSLISCSVWCIYCLRQRYHLSDPTPAIEEQLPRFIPYHDPGPCDHAFTLFSWQKSSEEITNNTNVSECAICMEEFRDGDLCMVRSNCHPIYHKRCIHSWLANDKHCPLCRGSIRRWVTDLEF